DAAPADQPSVSLTDPGPVLTQSVILRATTTLAPADVASTRFEASPSATDTWTAIAETPGLQTSFDTRELEDGLYDLRVVLTDTWGGPLTSAVSPDHLVANSSPVVKLADPGNALHEVIAMKATVSEGTITHVLFQRSPAGQEQWTDIDDTAEEPYGVTF